MAIANPTANPIITEVDAAIQRAVAFIEAKLGVFAPFVKPIIAEVVSAVEAEIAKVAASL